MDDLLHELRSLAEEGHLSAQFNLGAAYENGIDVKQDYGEAIYWYQKAAEQGHAPSQNNLGSMYHNGRGVPQDDATAVNWYRLAARRGNPTAQTNLGHMYAKGLGVLQDYAESARWYRLACAHEMADPVALTNLSVFYSMAWGVETNEQEAVRLLRLAADQGYLNAIDSLGLHTSTDKGSLKIFNKLLSVLGLQLTQDTRTASRTWAIYIFTGKVYRKTTSLPICGLISRQPNRLLTIRSQVFCGTRYPRK